MWLLVTAAGLPETPLANFRQATGTGSGSQVRAAFAYLLDHVAGAKGLDHQCKIWQVLQMLASFEIIEPLKFPVHSRTIQAVSRRSLSEACHCGAEPTERVCLVAVPCKLSAAV